MKLLSCAMVLCLAAAPALADAKLLRASPMNGARIKAPARITLTFAEALEPAFSGALLMDGDGKNLTGDPVSVSGAVMRLTPGRLAPGAYIVSWHAVGHEGHRIEGRLRFTVRP